MQQKASRCGVAGWGLTEVLWGTVRWAGQAVAAGERLPTHLWVRSHQLHVCTPTRGPPTQVVHVV